ncbi:MAG: heat-inducible transcription repressor HrcA [Gammaproteobacteria bacterium]|nr:heat-inducible transcription repressor HrcA [Gammaproteobacteria bacterium]
MTKEIQKTELNERAKRLLKAMIERYITDGQPVGSRTLSKTSGLDLSPATVRNVMADLEELGFIVSPHTSAGRIPTDKGMRLFVDNLIRIRDPKPKIIQTLSSQLNQAGSRKDLIASASTALSGLTHMAGVVTLPKRASQEIHRIEFIKLSGYKVLAVLVTTNGEVENRVFELTREYNASELEQAAAVLNQQLSGKRVSTVRKTILADMHKARESMNAMMQDAIDLAEQLFTEPQQSSGLVMAGQVNLMEFAELSNVDKLRTLFEAFNQQRDILHLLDQCLGADGVRIYIGQESGYDMFDGLSLVTSPYAVDDEVIGVLGVIGPSRMAYSKVIPIVDLTAKLLGSALNSTLSPS